MARIHFARWGGVALDLENEGPTLPDIFNRENNLRFRVTRRPRIDLDADGLLVFRERSEPSFRFSVSRQLAYRLLTYGGELYAETGWTGDIKFYSTDLEGSGLFLPRKLFFWTARRAFQVCDMSARKEVREFRRTTYSEKIAQP